MEWYDNPASIQEANESANRVLTTTSGNVQSFPLNSTSHIDKFESLQSGPSYLLSRPSRSAYPAPKSTLRSNDRRILLQQKLNERRLKRRFRLAQKYLQHPKFIAFRTRSRKDVNKVTGEVIWDDAVEAAFQNAIINIPGIGRKKKSQLGRTLGRNELITEWIQQETGKYRSRKQVSSHIQTLDKLFLPKSEEDFPGIPEWRMLTRASHDVGNDADGLEFYENSIADMVRDWRVLQADVSKPDSDFQSVLPTNYAKPEYEFSTLSSVSRLEFEMWVSLPNKMEEALHRYTRMQNNQAMAATEPLEQVEGWRKSWPELVTIIERSSSSQSFDIILINASFELMLDFPPPGSKLGISLELDFTSPGSETCTQFEPEIWSCITYTFQRGKIVATTKHKDCHSPGPGLVKPPFESKWWAEQFTRLTEKRRHAVDSGNDAAIAVADEFTRNFFKNLKIMQLVSANPGGANRSGSILTSNEYQEKKSAVLLWSFSQSTSKYVGTTTWQRLIPPPPRLAVNSPIPSALEMALPPLNMDTNLEASFNDHNFETDHGFIPHSLHPGGPVYSPDIEEELCQDGFMMAATHGGHNHGSIQFGRPSSLQHLGHLYHNQHAFQLNDHDTEVHGGQHNMSYVENQHHMFSSNLFDSQDDVHHVGPQQSAADQSQYDHWQQHGPEIRPVEQYQDRRHALLSFDVNTHNTLQAQLHTPHDLSDSVNLRQTNSAPPQQQSQPDVLNAVLSNLDNGPPTPALATDTRTQSDQDLTASHSNTYSRIQHEISHQPVLPAPTAIRPPLHQYHSFAGILRSAPSPENTFEDASRHDLNLLLDGFDGGHDDFLSMHVPVGMHNGLVRPHSLPLLVGQAADEGMRQDSEEAGVDEKQMEVKGGIFEEKCEEEGHWVDVDVDAHVKAESVSGV